MKKSFKNFQANKLSKQASNKVTGGARAARTGRNPRTNKVVEDDPACC